MLARLAGTLRIFRTIPYQNEQGATETVVLVHHPELLRWITPRETGVDLRLTVLNRRAGYPNLRELKVLRLGND